MAQQLDVLFAPFADASNSETILGLAVAVGLVLLLFGFAVIRMFGAIYKSADVMRDARDEDERRGS